MGWEVVRFGEGFMLRDDKARSISFEGEADSHAAGEAVRLYLKRPRLSEIQAAREQAEREALALRNEVADLRRVVSSTSQKAEDIERGVFKVERTEMALALHKERQEFAKKREEMQQRIDALENREGMLVKQALDAAGEADRLEEENKTLKKRKKTP